MIRPCLIFILSYAAIVGGKAQSDWIFPYLQEGRYGYTNTCGDTITPAVFEEATETFGGLGRIKLRGKYGYINNAGEIVIRPKYVEAGIFHSSYAAVTKKSGKKILIDRNGRRTYFNGYVCGAGFNGCLSPQPDSSSMYQRDGKYGFLMQKYVGRVDGKAQYIPDTLHPKYDTVVGIAQMLAYVSMQGKYGFLYTGRFAAGAAYVDSTVHLLYDEIKLYPCGHKHNAYQNFIAVRTDNLWGLVSTHYVAKIVCPPKYLSVKVSDSPYTPLVEYAPGRYGYVTQLTGGCQEHFCEK